MMGKKGWASKQKVLFTGSLRQLLLLLQKNHEETCYSFRSRDECREWDQNFQGFRRFMGGV